MEEIAIEVPAQVLRDATGVIVATGPRAADGHAIARAERQSLAAMNAVDEALAEQRYVDGAKVGRF